MGSTHHTPVPTADHVDAPPIETPPVGAGSWFRREPSARTRSVGIVAEIEQEIIERGWPVGEMIGHEAQLMERFDVSRSVLREAIRTLEHRGVVTVRTGRKGGLVVAEPRADAVQMAASLYLDYCGFDPKHLYATWWVLQKALIDLVVETATADELAELRECQRRDAARGTDGVERSTFVEELVRLAGNPILELFFQITRDLAMVHGHETTPEASRWFARQYESMADAIAAREPARAHAVLERFLLRLEATDSVLTRRRTRPSTT